jgi:formate hydrogenlyase subunit 6/NADH:ubiquinone oxidoreductase subunit I
MSACYAVKSMFLIYNIGTIKTLFLPIFIKPISIKVPGALLPYAKRYWGVIYLTVKDIYPIKF